MTVTRYRYDDLPETPSYEQAIAALGASEAATRRALVDLDRTRRELVTVRRDRARLLLLALVTTAVAILALVL